MEEEGFEEELQLAQEMKENYCKASVGKQFKETEPEKAAEIIHKLALIYKRRSPDKISLIKCVGLLNAAIVRKPSNISQIEADLTEVCKHILQKANAKNHAADLMDEATKVKSKIIFLRNKVDAYLKKTDVQNSFESGDLRNNFQVCKVSSIQCINTVIAQNYKQIMADLSKFCLGIMGQPPCDYAIVGMGSLARSEITPYSDFEHIILLFDHENYFSHLEYFRWYSTIFHVIILNLQESIIPSLNINCLSNEEATLKNWYFDAYTPRGISFDGMMPHACKFPLGRFKKTQSKPFVTELIKPISEMLKYLSSDENLKNGYHLADILTKTCFVFGNEDIFDQFKTGVKKYLNSKSKQAKIEEVKQQVSQDLNKFCTRFRLAKLKSFDTINIKQLVYRSSTLFITALARIHNISENSCFDVIQKMRDMSIISQQTSDRLSFAIAIACEMRLKVYMEKKSQCDNAFDLREHEKDIKKFLNIVGAKNTINYFQIAYCLQCEVAKQLNFTKLHFYSDPRLINFTIGLVFKLKLQKSTISINRLKIEWSLKEFSFDSCIQQLETNVDYETKLTDARLDKNLILQLSEHLYDANIFDEALEFYQQLLEILQKESISQSTTEHTIGVDLQIGNCKKHLQNNCSVEKYEEATYTFLKQSINLQHKRIAKTINDIGRCFAKMHHFEDALIHFKQSLEIKKSISFNQQNDPDVAVTLNNNGSCLISMHRPEDALINFKQALEITKSIPLNQQKDPDVAGTLSNIGTCLASMHRYEDALIHFKQSLEIMKSISLNQHKDPDVADILNNIGDCLRSMHRYEDALIYLKQSLEITKSISLNQQNDPNVAVTLNNIGNCLESTHCYEDALIYLKQSLEIAKSISLNQRKDPNVAGILNNIGICLKSIHRYEDALIHLKQAFEITKSISLNQQKDPDVADILNNIGTCLVSIHRYEDALIYLKQSLEITKSISLNQRKDLNVAFTLNNIGICLKNMHRYEDALIHFRKSLEIKKSISLNQQNDPDVAVTLCNIGSCLISMHRYEDAFIHLKQSLEITKSISLNQRKNLNVAVTLNNIGICLKNMHRYEDALIHLKQSLEFKKSISLNQLKDPNVARTLTNIGDCLISMHRYEDALIHLKQSLEITKSLSLNQQKDPNMADTLNNIGNCLASMHQYEDALMHFRQSLEIKKSISLNQRKDPHLAVTLNNIGNCLESMHYYEDALIYLKQSLKITKSISLNQHKDPDVAGIFNNIGTCLISMRCCEDALIYLKQAFEIAKSISLNQQKDPHVAGTLNNIGNCLKSMHRYEDALIHLKQSLEITKSISLNQQKDPDVARALTNIGNCLTSMHRYEDALIYLKQSLKIAKSISLNQRKDTNVAVTLNNIGNCLASMHQYEDASI